MRQITRFKLALRAAILLCGLALVALNCTYAQAQRGTRLEELALQVAEISQIPSVHESNLVTQTEITLHRDGYALSGADHQLSQENPARKYTETYAIKGLMYGEEAGQSVYISNELYHYGNMDQAQAAVKYIVAEASQHGNTPLDGTMATIRNTQSGMITAEDGLVVYWAVASKDNVLVFASVHGMRGPFAEEVFEGLATRVFNR